MRNTNGRCYIYRFLISTHFSKSTCFLIVQTYKHMHLATWVYGCSKGTWVIEHALVYYTYTYTIYSYSFTALLIYTPHIFTCTYTHMHAHTLPLRYCLDTLMDYILWNIYYKHGMEQLWRLYTCILVFTCPFHPKHILAFTSKGPIQCHHTCKLKSHTHIHIYTHAHTNTHT